MPDKLPEFMVLPGSRLPLSPKWDAWLVWLPLAVYWLSAAKAETAIPFFAQHAFMEFVAAA